MNNWRLLLLAVVAVLQPSGSFTEKYLIDGHQECCDHGSEIRDHLYGTFRKSVHEQRLNNRLTDRPDIHENRRYEARDESPLLRHSIERGAIERQFLPDRERISRHLENRQRDHPDSPNVEQSRIRDSRYERTSFEPSRHTSLDASRLTRTERETRDLLRDNRDAAPKRRMRQTERRERAARLSENRRTNNERDALRTNLRENRASMFEERRTQKSRFSVLGEHRESNSDSRIASRLRESRKQRLEPQKAINLARNIRSEQSRDDNRINERADQGRERETNRMSDDRVVSRLRESREHRLEPQRAINLERNIRSVQSRDDNRINERADQRRERDTNRMSDDGVVPRLRQSREQRIEPQRANHLARNYRSDERRTENNAIERVEQRQQRETSRMSDDRVVSRSRESQEQRLEPQRAINLARNTRLVQRWDDNRLNERADQKRDREENRMSDDRVVSRLRKSREQRLEPQRANLARNIRSIQSRVEERTIERVEQRQKRETSRLSDDRGITRLRESREQRLEPQRVVNLVRNTRSVQSRKDDRINERADQRRERGANRMSDDRAVSRLRESREQRLEPQRAVSLSRNIRSVHDREDNRNNERVEQKRERETSRISEDSVVLRLRESRQSLEQRLESQRIVRQSRDIGQDQSRNENRNNQKIEQRRQRDTNRMSEERLMSRVRESRQNPEERLDIRILSLSRIEEIRNRQEETQRQNSQTNERSEYREQNIRESRDRLIPENKENSRLSRNSERNDERLQSARRVSVERRQDSHRISRIVLAADSRSPQRENTRDRRSVNERADYRRQNEVNRERATREESRNFEAQRSRSTIPSTLRDVRNDVRNRAVSNDREIRRELKSERRESLEIRLKSADMAMERIDQTRESRNRIQNAQVSTVHETLIQEKSDSDMNWQYLFYTLQGAYLCGLLVQMLTEKSMTSKTSNFSWWIPVSSKLIKVD